MVKCISLALTEIGAVNISFTLTAVQDIWVEAVIVRIIAACDHILKHELRLKMDGTDAEIRVVAVSSHPSQYIRGHHRRRNSV